MSSKAITVGKKSVIFIDCSNKTPDQIDEITMTLQEARDLLKGMPERSAFIITDFTLSKFNPELVTLFSDFTSANTKTVRESVLVGLSDHHKVIVSIFKKLHHRDFTLVDTFEDAAKYLMSVQ